MEKYNLKSLLRDPEDKRDFIFKSQDILLESTIPSRIDHTDMMSPVKDQKSLGSCVSFAVAAMKEWQENVEHVREISNGKKDTRDGKKQDLSEQWIYYKCKMIDPWPNEEGTSIRYAMKVLQKIGVPDEKGWKYNDRMVGKPEIWSPMVARWNKIGEYKRVLNIDDLRVALAQSPVPIGIGVFAEMFNVDGTGSVKNPANPNQCYGGHAVCAVSYNDAARVIKFKNSWGSSWGRSGYGYISYDYINNYMWDAWTCNDISVTKNMLSGKYEEIKR